MIQPSAEAELDELMDAESYKSFVVEESEE